MLTNITYRPTWGCAPKILVIAFVCGFIATLTTGCGDSADNSTTPIPIVTTGGYHVQLSTSELAALDAQADTAPLKVDPPVLNMKVERVQRTFGVSESGVTISNHFENFDGTSYRVTVARGNGDTGYSEMVLQTTL